MLLETTIHRVRHIIAQSAWDELINVVQEIHPPDQAELIKVPSSEERRLLLEHLSDELLADILAELDYEAQQALLMEVDKEKISLILDEMASDDAADFLGELGVDEAQEFLELMQEDEAEEVRELLVYPEETAGGLMTTEYIAISRDRTVEATIEVLRELSPDAETVYYVYVIDENGTLVGVLSLRDLIISDPQKCIGELMREKVITVPVGTDQEEVARILNKYDFLALPVIDNKKRLIGIITVDDIMDVITEETTEDFTKMAGIHGMDDLRISPYEATCRRLPWLIILLFAGLFSGLIVDRFEQTLQAVVSLARFIPLIAGMAGNTGTQALAVVVRTLALERGTGPSVWRLLRQEAKIGLIVGTVNGVLVAILAFVWQGNPILGFVIGISLWLTMIVATIVGAGVPILFHCFQIDPAVASGPFIATVNDVVGLTIYFSQATRFLAYL